MIVQCRHIRLVHFDGNRWLVVYFFVIRVASLQARHLDVRLFVHYRLRYTQYKHTEVYPHGYAV